MLLSVASYNIHQAVGIDGKRDRRRMLRVLGDLNADIIGLQEVDTNESGHEMFQLDYLARESGLKAIAGPTMRRQDNDFGNVLLTRHKLLDVRSVDLSVSGREPRGAIDVDLAIGGITVRVIVTHFGLSSRERYYQSELLIKLIGQHRDALVIVLSDLNEWHPHSRMLRNLKPYFGKSARLPTFPSWLPSLALDRIWVWPEKALVSTHVHRKPPARWASDHLPITAKITTAFCARR